MKILHVIKTKLDETTSVHCYATYELSFKFKTAHRLIESASRTVDPGTAKITKKTSRFQKCESIDRIGYKRGISPSSSNRKMIKR